MEHFYESIKTETVRIVCALIDRLSRIYIGLKRKRSIAKNRHMLKRLGAYLLNDLGFDTDGQKLKDLDILACHNHSTPVFLLLIPSDKIDTPQTTAEETLQPTVSCSNSCNISNTSHPFSF